MRDMTNDFSRHVLWLLPHRDISNSLSPCGIPVYILQMLTILPYIHDILLVIVRHLIQASLRYKCLSRRWQNDVIETEDVAKVSITSFQHLLQRHLFYISNTPCMRCLTALENGPFCSLSFTKLSSRIAYWG